jgi:RHS repeat-associated protein
VGTAIPTATGSATPTVTATVTATTTCSAIDYSYDNNGNLTTESRCGAATTYTYDSDNRLTGVVAGGVTTTMVYDYDGNLVQKTVGEQVMRYVYAGGPAPVEEINVNTGAQKDFIQVNGRTWGVMEATSNTYFHHDAIGSVVALSNDSGQVTDTYEYEPFGKVLLHQGTSTNDYQFVGGYGVRKLNDTLDTMGVRQYSETVGRFTTSDPLGYKAGDVNFYRYVKNRCLVYIDPTGKAYFAIRPLDPLGIPVPIEGDLYHEQVFFEDGKSPSNEGYFKDGVHDDITGLSYTKTQTGFDDCAMRKALSEVRKIFDTSASSYDLLYHNCQDYAAALRDAYYIVLGTE